MVASATAAKSVLLIASLPANLLAAQADKDG
jgi:hypothetical protein